MSRSPLNADRWLQAWQAIFPAKNRPAGVESRGSAPQPRNRKALVIEAMEDRLLLSVTASKTPHVPSAEHGTPIQANSIGRPSGVQFAISADALRAGRQGTTISQVSGVGVRGGFANLTATLTSSQGPVAGKVVRFQVAGRPVGVAITDSHGVATLANAGIRGIRVGFYPNAVQASFNGDQATRPSSARGGLTVSRFAAVISQVAGVGVYSTDSTFTARLTSNGSPVSGQTVQFLLNGQSVGTASTNGQGVANLSGVNTRLWNAGTYASAITARLVTNVDYQGTPATGNLRINPAQASLTLGNLNQTADGSAKSVSVTTNPSGLANVVVYTDSSNHVVPNPTAPGSYNVFATITNPNYTGSAAGTLVLAQSIVHVTPVLGNLNQTYDGSAKSVSVSTNPQGLAVNLKYTDSNNNVVANPTDAGSYHVTATITSPGYVGSASGTFVIAKAQLTVTGLVAGSRTYDGTRSTVIDTHDAKLVGLAAGDQVTLNTSKVTGTFADKNVGVDKVVTLAGLTAAGADLGNYILVQPTVKADITPIVLSVSGITATDKTYDSTTAATIDASHAVLEGVLPGETVVLNTSNASGQFEDKNVNNAKPITVSGLTISGADAGNYVLPLGITTSANIIQAYATVSGIIALDKPFDGLDNAALDTSHAVLSGIFPGDDVQMVLTDAIGYFDNPFIGTSHTVTIYAVYLTGLDNANYFVLVDTAMANITE